MKARRSPNSKVPTDARNAAIGGKRSRRAGHAQRTHWVEDGPSPFSPPEDWHEPGREGSADYRVVVQPAGKGFQHVVTEEEIRARLAELPQAMLAPLAVIQLSRMTRKKQTFPCYGMQWGTTLYLYPMEVGLVESFPRPPRPPQLTEARMYGGLWRHVPPKTWKLTWTAAAIQDFYLNNVLIHELGHLLDDRNTGYIDRERYAEWFAIEYGYRPSRRKDLARRAAEKIVRRRHRKK